MTKKLVYAELSTDRLPAKLLLELTKVTSPVPPVRVVLPVTATAPPLIPDPVAVKFPPIFKLPNVSGLELVMATSPSAEPAVPAKVTVPVKALAALAAVNDFVAGKVKELAPATDIWPTVRFPT